MLMQSPKTPYYLQTALDRAIELFAERDSQKSHEKLSQQRFCHQELGHIKVLAQIEAGLARYREEAKAVDICSQGQASFKATSKDLREEQHCSEMLGKHLRAVGKPKPDDRVDAHAMVAGKHVEAAEIRAVMARLRIRVDDPDNGMWMPRRSKDTPHWAFPACPPHSRIHRYNYYFWVRSHLLHLADEMLFRKTLQLMAKQLHEGHYPDYVMMRKGQGLPFEDDL